MGRECECFLKFRARTLSRRTDCVLLSKARDRLHLRRTTEQHVPEVEVQVKRRRTASLSNQECHLYPRRSQQQQQQVPVVDFQAELRQAFLAETPRGG
ncbi:SNRPN upstream reading frame protein isoform X1 [Balaenoptera acutorostrata]|uniref:SNRPN upstream reading frame protein isoform X1 n=1 Tax=Balaenoptera acutorostrata TaxID=9767 RepID=A0A452CET0_BALAC|nr:SNRPN upstream reading frame protein isoform X1 [Balaenoptera acutorostrata]XP_028021510.1 SNRPN upstream reading frame protein isoform X1 [Balaenoptera acutorostrata]XP_057398295.1 SNRPN upstream reading frame protein isoform X1 [Balaenoptera acutorostrata]